MPRKKKGSVDQLIEKERWKGYGKWLSEQRLLVPRTQEQAVEIVKNASDAVEKVSLRQWKRYEAGARVPQKKIKAIARGINVPYEKAMRRAGYVVSSEDIDTDAYLQRIKDALIEGDLQSALEQLFNLHRMIEARKRSIQRPSIGATAVDFAIAAIALDRMPDWLRTELVNYVQSRTADKPGSPEPLGKLRDEIRREIDRALRERVLKEIEAEDRMMEQAGDRQGWDFGE